MSIVSQTCRRVLDSCSQKRTFFTIISAVVRQILMDLSTTGWTSSCTALSIAGRTNCFRWGCCWNSGICRKRFIKNTVHNLFVHLKEIIVEITIIVIMQNRVDQYCEVLRRNCCVIVLVHQLCSLVYQQTTILHSSFFNSKDYSVTDEVNAKDKRLHKDWDKALSVSIFLLHLILLSSNNHSRYSTKALISPI